MTGSVTSHGPIAWMARHPVAANLLLLMLLLGGLVNAFQVTQKVFPEFSLDAVQISVSYLGAAPAEIEDSIIRRIEEQVEAIDGIEQMTAAATEGAGTVTLEFARGTDVAAKLDEIKAEVDRITTFPEEAEEPVVKEMTNRRRVIELAVHGDVPERALKEMAYRIKDELTGKDTISFADVTLVRPYEVSVEMDNATLRALGLTLEDVAGLIRQESLDLPGGDLSTPAEDVLLRTVGRNFDREDFAEIVLLTSPEGGQITLGHVATVHDGFRDQDLETRFNGKPVALVKLYRVGDEQVLTIVEDARAYLRDEASLPEGIQVSVWRDDAEELENRMNLLIKNAILGLTLVMITLTLFLDARLAFWVAVGIGVSFVATFTVMVMLDMSINQLSLFGFILAIGIVVDDAIVTGENIYAARQAGLPPREAAVTGATRIAGPVIFAVATTVLAFIPLLLVPGQIGKFLANIPAIVIIVLLWSLVESLLVLPRHLSTLPAHDPDKAPANAFERFKRRVQDGLERFIHGPLDRALRYAVRDWPVVLGGGVGLLVVTLTLFMAGYVPFSFFPVIEGRYVSAQVELPEGSPVAQTRAVNDILTRHAQAVAETLNREEDSSTPAVTGIFATAGTQLIDGPPTQGDGGGGQTHKGSVVVELSPPQVRDFPTELFEQRWRDAVGTLPQVRKLTFSSRLVNLGEAVQIELSAGSETALDRALEGVQEGLRNIGGVFDVRNDRDRGKTELKITLKPEARAYGLTLSDLARQVRAGFFGAEALRVQRGREELRVYARLSEDERNSLADLTNYRIRTPGGGLVPFGTVASVTQGLSPSTIRRRDGRRIVTVTASVDRAEITGGDVIGVLTSDILPALQDEIPSLSYSFGGEQREQGKAIPAMLRNFGLAMAAMYALLALAFGSYIKPLIIMASIPFGLVGAIGGHLLMGLNLTILSMFGIVGLAGVIVNGALVQIDFINEELRGGKPLREAIVDGAKGRFRPIMLTAVTTFLGVFPLIIEQSIQAQFLIPLAASIGFGVLVGAAILMLIIPALLMAEDWARRIARQALDHAKVLLHGD